LRSQTEATSARGNALYGLKQNTKLLGEVRKYEHLISLFPTLQNQETKHYSVINDVYNF